MITKVFKSGNSMAVRIPKQIKIDADEVEITQEGDVITLRPVKKDMREVLELFGQFSDDYFAEGREDLPPQERDFE